MIDNCALVEIAQGSQKGQALCALLLKNEKVIAPDLIVYEATSVMRKIALSGQLSTSEAMRKCDKMLEIIDELVPGEELRTEALSESVRLNHSSYDMYYFVLARRTGSTLFTLDQKLIKLCEANGVNALSEEAF